MSKIREALRVCARWLSGDPDESPKPPPISSRAYVREWHRRQRDALRRARQSQESMTKH